MEFRPPTVTDFGSIAAHTFTRCSTATGGPDAPPKDHEDFPHDKFGECSSGHAIS